MPTLFSAVNAHFHHKKDFTTFAVSLFTQQNRCLLCATAAVVQSAIAYAPSLPRKQSIGIRRRENERLGSIDCFLTTDLCDIQKDRFLAISECRANIAYSRAPAEDKEPLIKSL
jgi:hypothetical protein